MVNFRYVIALSLLAGIAANGFGQDRYWYKNFTGTIDKYPFTLHLHKTDHNYSGYYYYNKTQRPFYFFGNDTTQDNRIHLLGWVPAARSDNELFVLKLEGDSLTGEWKKTSTASDPALPVKARINTSLSPAFDLVYTSGSQKLRPEMEQTPAASYEAAIVWPKGKSAAINLLKRMINKRMGFKNTQADIGPLLLAYRKSFLADYLEENRNVPDSELLNFSSGYIQDVSSKIMVVYHSSRILSLAQLNYEYMGGAHGNYGTTYICINPATGKPYTLSTVLSAAGKKRLNSLLEKNFRKDQNLSAQQPLTDAGLFEDKIEANDNFYLTGTGITFSYAPYEIGPYVMGEIAVFIPYSDLGPAGLNPSFRK